MATVSNYNEADLPGSGSPQPIDFDGDETTDATLEVSPEARTGLSHYLSFYNHERPHQALGYLTPAEIYFQK